MTKLKYNARLNVFEDQVDLLVRILIFEQMSFLRTVSLQAEKKNITSILLLISLETHGYIKQ